MKSADWLKVPGYGQHGVDILADLAAAEAERVKDAANLLHEFTRAETAERANAVMLNALEHVRAHAHYAPGTGELVEAAIIAGRIG
jgi:uncharacterized protein with gpF-like domain